MKNRILDLLSVTSAERKGIILLVIIIIIISGIQAYVAFHSHEEAPFADSAIFTDLVFADRTNSPGDSTYYAGYSPAPEITDTFELFAFDPNTVNVVDLRRLGMSSRVSRTWLNYRLHGGRFRTASDVQKIYGMSPAIYERIEPYITISQQPKAITYPSKAINYPSKEREYKREDLNRADSADLENLRGIGPVLSGRIIRYRSLLGGFYSAEQLLEVYGFPDTLVETVSRAFYADTSNLVRININEVSEDVLARHPYVGRHLAKGIIKYRRSVNKISTINELKINGLLSDEQLEKVKKYLVI